MSGRTSAPQLTQFCVQVLQKIGLSHEHAFVVADSLVAADLRGHYSHGVIRFPFIVKRLLDGGSKINPEIKVIRENLATALLEGDCGLGQVVAMNAMEKAMEKAHQAGIGFVSVRNSGHFGTAGYYAMRPLKEDMIGFVWSNGAPVMAPWGGCASAIGNNPMAVGIPAGELDPIVFDISMSTVAGGKVRLAAKKGEKIPTDWVVDKDGNKTDDPNALPNGGALMAFGHKGYGLSVVGEVLAGALPGASLLSQIPIWFEKTAEPTNIGHMMMAIDIKSFEDPPVFKKRVDDIIRSLKKTKPVKGVKEVLLPGDLEMAMEKKQLAEGLDISSPVIADLEKIALDYGIAFPN